MIREDPATERIAGTVERVTFHSEESGFCVLRVKAKGHRDLVTVVGSAAVVNAGEFVEADGTWINDRQHGLQFKSTRLQVVPPTTREGIEKYLASGMIRGIGPHFARKLLQKFGEQVFDIIELEPTRLLELDGIGPLRKERICDAWREQKMVRAIMVFLQSHGVGTARAVRIYKTYGDTAIDKVREDPYRLALDIHGIGFKTADALAARLGIPPDSLLRARAGVRHVLQDYSTAGHCAALQTVLLAKTSELLGIDEQLVATAIAEEVRAERLVAATLEGEACFYLTALHRAECGVAERLSALLHAVPPWGRIDADKAVVWVQEQTHLELSASQRSAVGLALRSKVSIITGGPGVGKTTVVNSILRILAAKKMRLLLAAPTGRAAKKLAESTGREAKTLHRLLEFDPKSHGFKRGADLPLDADIIVLDETSMVDVVLMNQLLRAVPARAGLLLVGDIDQLPSVGPGSVLADVIRSGVVPCARLTEIFRQAQASRIILNAHRINQGFMPLGTAKGDDTDSDFYFIPSETPEEVFDKLMQVVIERIPQRFGLHPVRDIQVLTPMNRGGLGARALNNELQARLNKSAGESVERFGWRYAPGDKVVQTVNNYDKDVYNGDVGNVDRIDSDEGVIHINFEGRTVEYEFGELDEVALAYALTIHKSQGSEYPAVVLPVCTQHYTLLERNLLYTGVTRGRQLVVLIGQRKAVGMCVSTVKAARRLTDLEKRLRVSMAA